MKAAEPERWEWLAEMAAELLADRQRGYPKLVQAKRLTQSAADDGIRVMAGIAADWRRITALYAGQAVPAEDTSATRDEKRQALGSAVERLRAIFQRAYAALPATLPPPMGAVIAGSDKAGLTMEELIGLANRGTIAVDAIRPAYQAWDRLKAAEQMLAAEQGQHRPAFWAEVNAELRQRRQAKAAA